MKKILLSCVFCLTIISAYSQKVPTGHVYYILPAKPVISDTVKVVYTIGYTGLLKKIFVDTKVAQDTIIIEGCFAYTGAAQPYYLQNTLVAGQLKAGWHYVRISVNMSDDPDSCTYASVNTTIDSFYVSKFASINALALDQAISVYPNPTNAKQTLSLSLERPSQVSIQLFDLSGRMLKRVYEGHAGQGEQRFDIDLSGLLPGIYFCKVGVNGQEKVVKVVRR